MILKREILRFTIRLSHLYHQIRLFKVKLVSKLSRIIINGLVQNLTTADLIRVSQNLSGSATQKVWQGVKSHRESAMSILGSLVK